LYGILTTKELFVDSITTKSTKPSPNSHSNAISVVVAMVLIFRGDDGTEKQLNYIVSQYNDLFTTIHVERV